MSRNYFRVKTFSVDEVLKSVELTPFGNKIRKKRVIFKGVNVNLTSQRLQLFKLQGVECVNCGAKGEFFAAESINEGENCHLNLWGYRTNGEEVLFTKDHIIPKSRGGKDHLSNYQVMCEYCNQNKGSRLDSEIEEITSKNIYGEETSFKDPGFIVVRFKKNDVILYTSCAQRVSEHMVHSILKNRKEVHSWRSEKNTRAFTLGDTSRSQLFIAKKGKVWSMPSSMIPEGTTKIITEVIPW